MNNRDITGQKFDRLLAVKFEFRVKREDEQGYRYFWSFKCDCGKVVTRVIDSVIYKNGVKSCTCYTTEKIVKRNKTHGMSKNSFYDIYHSIKNRCEYPRNKFYKNYGGRGIKCLWNSFEEFKQDMYSSYDNKLDIDRIDNNGNYCKENCRWVSRKENMRNTRANVIIEFSGEKHCLTEWAENLGLKVGTLWSRIDRGWSIDKALTTMVR
mgnify:CR=1 FL=1